MSKREDVEIGYLCGKGHYVFHADPDGSSDCGSKRIAGLYARWEVDADDWAGAPLDEVVAEASTHLGEVIAGWRAGA